MIVRAAVGSQGTAVVPSHSEFKHAVAYCAFVSDYNQISS
jgi:hypothetical protein